VEKKSLHYFTVVISTWQEKSAIPTFAIVEYHRPVVGASDRRLLFRSVLSQFLPSLGHILLKLSQWLLERQRASRLLLALALAIG
jgi:hypothetical protein